MIVEKENCRIAGLTPFVIDSNFALSPTFVDKSLKLYRVYTCRWIDGQLEAHFSGHVGDEGILVWETFSQPDYDQWHAGFRFLTERE